MNIQPIRGSDLSCSRASKLFRLMWKDRPRGAFRDFDEPWRGMALRLLEIDLEGRWDLWDSMLDELNLADNLKLIRALNGVDWAWPAGGVPVAHPLKTSRSAAAKTK